MSLTDLGIVILCGVIGWCIVSWIISIVKQQKQPPLDLSGDSRRPQAPPDGRDPPPRS